MKQRIVFLVPLKFVIAEFFLYIVHGTKVKLCEARIKL